MPAIAQMDALVPAKDRLPVMMSSKNWQHKPVKWILRRPILDIKNHEPAVPIIPRAEFAIDKEKEFLAFMPAWVMK